MQFEQANLELAQAGQQAGFTVLAAGGGFGVLHLSGAFGLAGAGELDALTSRITPIRDAIQTGAIRDQAGLDARLQQAHVVVDAPGHVPIDESGVTELPHDTLSPSSFQPASSRETPPLTPQVVNEVSHRLGIAEGQLEMRPFKSGGLNDVYDLASHDPAARTHFGGGPEVPAELHGEPVDAYKGKLSYDLSPETAVRDEQSLEAIQNRLKHDPQYEGVHLAETHILGKTSGGQRMIVQRTVHGDAFVPVLRGALEPGLGRTALSDAGLRNLFADLFQSETGQDMPLSEIFEPTRFRQHFKTAAFFNHDLETDAVQHMSDTEIAQLRQAWESPDMARMRDLTRKLQNLDRDPALVNANYPLHELDRSLVNTPIWGNYPTGLNGDFGHKNMLFWRGPDGRLNLTLYDF
jgi:hypothetical protein